MVGSQCYIYMAIANYETSISSKSRSRQLSQLSRTHLSFSPIRQLWARTLLV
ncbi:hypothetical protein [Nostoc sp.]|uniref:hypothetical protein n=1 Tax=Nostoc sp. TaxID=1180 RepID=UPI002FF6E692